MKKLIMFAFSIGLFLIGSQAKADWARQGEFAVECTTFAFSSTAQNINIGETWYLGCSFSTGTASTDWLNIYDSTTTTTGNLAGQTMLRDYNFVNSTQATGVASTKWAVRPIKVHKGLTVAPSVATYNLITVFWAKPTEK